MTRSDVPLPHVIAWNLTRRCNLACAHCYISAGSWHSSEGELTTEECRRITDGILSINPSPMIILSGGEPLVRDDLEAIASHATAGGATVVVGTNGVGLTSERITSLMAAGVQGVAISIDSLDPVYHDRFRHGAGALDETLAAVDRVRERGLDFIVQTTVTRGNADEIEAIASWAADRNAVAFNCYFLVSTGRGSGMTPLTPVENERILDRLLDLEIRYRGRMLVRSKCQPQIMRHAYERDPESPLLSYSTRCPCGVQYCRITPEGAVTPCPYSPIVAGDLRSEPFGEIWRSSRVFREIRSGELGGKCGRCEYREICGGCRARAYADTGDVLAADESCAYEPGDFRQPVGTTRNLTYGSDHSQRMSWAPAASQRIEKIPSFVRGVVAARVEKYAEEQGYQEVTVDVLDEVRSAMPVDFTKRRPFFMRGERE